MSSRTTPRQRRYPSMKAIANRRVLTKDRVESIIQLALDEAGIPYYMGSEPFPECQHLDFYIPSLDVHIECKHRYTDRVTKQLSRADNIIYIQSIKSALSFIKLMSLNVNVDGIIKRAVDRERHCKAIHDDMLTHQDNINKLTTRVTDG